MKTKKRYVGSMGEGRVAYIRKHYFTKQDLIQIIAHAMSSDVTNHEYVLEEEQKVITGVKKHPSKKWCIEQIKTYMCHVSLEEEVMYNDFEAPLQSLAIYLVEKYRLF